MGKEPSPALTMFRCSCSSLTPVTLKKNHLQRHCPSASVVLQNCRYGQCLIQLLFTFTTHSRSEWREELRCCHADGAKSLHEVGSLVALTVWISAQPSREHLSLVSLPSQAVTSFQV